MRNYKCAKCGSLFTPRAFRAGRAPKYGHGLATWCIYNNLVCGQNLGRIRRALIDLLNRESRNPRFFALSHPSENTPTVYDNILTHLLKGPLLHIDETEVKLKVASGYVWVFAEHGCGLL